MINWHFFWPRPEEQPSGEEKNPQANGEEFLPLKVGEATCSVHQGGPLACRLARGSAPHELLHNQAKGSVRPAYLALSNLSRR